MAIIGQGISLLGMTHEKFHYSFYLAAGVTAADVGKAVSLDDSAPNTVKLAADGDQIIGKLVVREDRTVEGVLVATVALRGGFKFEKASGAAAISVGDTVVGAGDGEVKAAAAADHSDNMVVEVDGDYVIIVR